jgi:hypothetical protein
VSKLLAEVDEEHEEHEEPEDEEHEEHEEPEDEEHEEHEELETETVTAMVVDGEEEPEEEGGEEQEEVMGMPIVGGIGELGNLDWTGLDEG